MDRNEYRDEEEDESPPDAYWRRRAITLALGLGLLGIVAWGASSSSPKGSQSGNDSLVPATALGTAVPGLPTTSPGIGAGLASSGPTPTPSGPTPSPSGSPSASPSASARPAARPSPAAAAMAPVHPGGACPSGSVVLSLFTDRTSYTQGQYPQFDVYAVSTSQGSCTFDPGQLQVLVMSAGRIIWDSSDCSRPGSGHPAVLATGVPAQAEVTWDRSITLPGCEVLAADTRSGMYQVQARTATVASPIRTFKLTS
jgi:hypothetical protein